MENGNLNKGKKNGDKERRLRVRGAREMQKKRDVAQERIANTEQRAKNGGRTEEPFTCSPGSASRLAHCTSRDPQRAQTACTCSAGLYASNCEARLQISFSADVCSQVCGPVGLRVQEAKAGRIREMPSSSEKTPKTALRASPNATLFQHLAVDGIS